MKIPVKGVLELFVLYELSTEPHSGKRLLEEIEKTTGGKWRPSPGAIYPLLRKLEEKGMVKPALSTNEGRREISYAITRKGKSELERMKKRLMDEVEKNFETLMPITMKVMHELNDDELEEMKGQLTIMTKLSTYVFSLPIEKRKKLLKKLSVLGGAFASIKGIE